MVLIDVQDRISIRTGEGDSPINTFLPSSNLAQCARILDHVRLSRQITECVMVAKLCRSYNLMMDSFGSLPWGINLHPVYKLWILNDRCSLIHLHNYTAALNKEYKHRTNQDHKSFIETNWQKFIGDNVDAWGKEIHWDEMVHESHRSKLLGKDSSHYYTMFMREGLSIPGELEYEWLSPKEI